MERREVPPVQPTLTNCSHLPLSGIMNHLQERFITNNIDDTFFTNDDFLNIGNRDYTSGGGHGGRGSYNGYGGGYRGRIPHHRPIVIIQPPAVTQAAEDTFLDGLTSLLPLAYLLPLALPDHCGGEEEEEEGD